MKQNRFNSLKNNIETEIASIREALRKWSSYNGTQEPITASELAGTGMSYLAWKKRMDQRLFELSRALSRMEGESYGTCADCGEDIPIQRLEAVPDTVYCVGCMRHREG